MSLYTLITTHTSFYAHTLHSIGLGKEGGCTRPIDVQYAQTFLVQLSLSRKMHRKKTTLRALRAWVVYSCPSAIYV